MSLKKTIGKLSLLLVVFGWFSPVACQASGPQWAKNAIEDGGISLYTLFAILLLISMIAAVVGIILFIVSSVKKQQNKDIMKSTLISMISGLPFFIFMVIMSASLEVLNFGAYLMIAGWGMSLILLGIDKQKE